MLFFKIPFFLFISFSTFFENIIIVFVFALHIMFFFHFNQDKIFFVQSSEFLICKPFLHWCKSVLAEPLCCLHWYQSKWSQLIDLALSSICYSFRDQRLVWAFDNLVPLEVIMIFFSFISSVHCWCLMCPSDWWWNTDTLNKEKYTNSPDISASLVCWPLLIILALHSQSINYNQCWD